MLNVENVNKQIDKGPAKRMTDNKMDKNVGWNRIAVKTLAEECWKSGRAATR